MIFFIFDEYVIFSSLSYLVLARAQQRSSLSYSTNDPLNPTTNSHRNDLQEEKARAQQRELAAHQRESEARAAEEQAVSDQGQIPE